MKKWSYMFGLNNGLHSEDPYSAYRHVQITGKVLKPRPVAERAPRAELTILPDKGLSEASRLSHEPRCVASIQLYDTVFRGLVSMPSDALPLVLQLLIAGRTKYFDLYGPPIRYRKSLIRNYHIAMEIDEDELLPDD